eukprot:6172557-Pleurochrysis_carterae.AAC.3
MVVQVPERRQTQDSEDAATDRNAAFMSRLSTRAKQFGHGQKRGGHAAGRRAVQTRECRVRAAGRRLARGVADIKTWVGDACTLLHPAARFIQ